MIQVKNGTVGEDIGFERIRRITGYLSPMGRWNNGKVAELKDRVKHSVSGSCGRALSTDK